MVLAQLLSALKKVKVEYEWEAGESGASVTVWNPKL